MWKSGRQVTGNFEENIIFHVNCMDLLHAANLRHGTDGFISTPKEGELKVIFAMKKPRFSGRGCTRKHG
jgi:hypothetical protein